MTNEILPWTVRPPFVHRIASLMPRARRCETVGQAVAENAPQDDTLKIDRKQDYMMAFENSKQYGSPHRFLAQLVGGWSGKTLTWLDPTAEPHQSPIQGSIQLILEGRFAIYLYQSTIDGEPQHGMFIFGFNTISNQYEASWVDSFHNNTAIMFCTGEATNNGFFVIGSYPDPTGGPDWGWRTEVELAEDGLSITAFNMSPEGGEAKAFETKLTRVKK